MLNIPVRVFDKIVIERIQGITTDKVSEDQGGLRTREVCVHQTFNVRMMPKKMLRKEKVCAASMNELREGIQQSRLACDVGYMEGLWSRCSHLYAAKASNRYICNYLDQRKIKVKFSE